MPPSSPIEINVQYDSLRKPLTIIWTTAFLVLLYHGLYYLHAGNVDWIGRSDFTWKNLAQFLLIDQFLIESISVGIIFFIIRFCARIFNFNHAKLTLKGIAQYEIRFIPIAFFAFFIFNPITQTIRFLYHNYPTLDWDTYVENYFYSFRLYMIYVSPSLIAVLAGLNVNLIKNYCRHITRTSGSTSKKYPAFLFANDNWGEVPIAIEEIQFIQKENRKTYLYTETNKLQLKLNIAEAEEALNPVLFLRINRSVIVSVKQIKNYSFWENDKYIVRLKNEKELVMSRERLHEIKSRLKSES